MVRTKAYFGKYLKGNVNQKSTYNYFEDKLAYLCSISEISIELDDASQVECKA